MKVLLFSAIFCAIVTVSANGQIISGTVLDAIGNPIPFASVYLDKIYEGTTSDADGSFSFETNHKGKAVLVASAIGYETTRIDLTTSDNQSLKVILQEATELLKPVVITAGSFDASPESKAVVLKPMDIVMNAGAEGDIYKAIETLPGVSKVGDETGLFVRGGDAYETKTIIDGTISENPFFSEMPNISSRSRFDPFMFKGTNFTTGGYSAEYGQALSSVLILHTQDIPDNSATNFGINMAGVSLSHVQVWKEKTSVIAGLDYNNLMLLFSSMPQNVNWQKEPEGYNANLAFRHKTKQGMFKTFFQHQEGETGLYTTNPQSLQDSDLFINKNKNSYWNAHYKGSLDENWGIYGGLSFNHNRDKNAVAYTPFGEENRSMQGKITLYNQMGEHTSLKLGAESFTYYNHFRFDQNRFRLDDQYSAAFAETDFSLGENWAFRFGLRSAYSSLLNMANLAPRASMAYKAGENGSVSLAYGQFYQKPENDYLYRASNLDFERSTHYIANYQWIGDDRSFRSEIYHKQYENLVKNGINNDVNNSGNGHSRGLDIFWKDEKTVDNLNYWISYSYVDAKRHYRDFPTTATPGFVTDHTLSIVTNYSFEVSGLNPGITYTFASGRRYINPNSDNFLQDKTKAYHHIGVNLSYVTSIFGNFAVIYGALSNPFGFDQVFGYQYSENGTGRIAIGPAAKRTFFLGFFMSIR